MSIHIVSRREKMIKKSKILLTLLVIVTLVIIGIFLSIIPDEKEAITAMDGKIVADEIASNWSVNATLVGVRKSGSANTQNQFQSWYYIYWDASNNSRPHKCIEIRINTTGYTEHTFEDWSSPNIPIENWNIDNDNAYEIAINNENIKSFLKHNPIIDGFSLSSGSNQAVWVIEWAYDAGIDDPKWARIEIDATTGEVLYVEVDD